MWLKKKAGKDAIQADLEPSGQLPLNQIAALWELKPESLIAGKLLLRRDENGNSRLSLDQIASLMPPENNGLSQQTPLLITGSPAIAVVPEVVPELERLFKKQLKHARKPVLGLSALRASPVLPLVEGTLEMELGTYFSLEGRDNTMRMQIRGAAHIFNNFMCTTSFPEEQLRRSRALLMLVGFPGVGKTTMGSATAALLRELWDGNQEEIDELLHEILSDKLVMDFKTLVANSKHFSCLMFREIEAAGDGQTLHEERGLAPQQLLALNTLYASLSSADRWSLQPRHADGDFVWSYTDMLHRLSPMVKERITFDDVICFIRSGLGIPEDDRILLSFFFDEANKSKPSPRQSVSWFQEMMSSYVRWLHKNHAGKTFVVMTAATTRFSVATLQGTASGNTQSIFIPMPPLSDEECHRVIHKFLCRLQRTLDRGGNAVVSEDMKQVISLCGGNPRILSHLLQAFCTSSPNTDINPEDLYAELSRGLITKERMEELILGAWKQIGGSYYVNYMAPERLRLILRAMQASLLGEVVHRSQLVLTGFPDMWGDLESMGLVGLKSETMVASETSATIPVRVVFSTLILRYVFSLSRDKLSRFLPPMDSSDWKVKEKADLYTIMFMILLHHEVSGSSTFKLDQVLPQGWFIPTNLRQLEFVVPPCSETGWEVMQAPQLKSATRFWTFMNDNTSRWAFIGPQNWGTDSWMRLVCATNQQVMLVAIESKCCSCPHSLPVVSYGGIVDKAMKDLEPILCAPSSPSSQSNLSSPSQKRRRLTLLEEVRSHGFGLDQVVFLYMSDQNVGKALEEHKSGSERMTGVACRLIISGEHPSDSLFSKMSQVRHMMVFTPKDDIFFEL